MTDSPTHSLDEYPIRTIPATPLWTENYAALGADPVSGVGFYYSCGRWIGDPTVWREVLTVQLPDGRILFAKNYGRRQSPTGAGASLTAWEVVTPERELVLSFDGPMAQGSVDAFLADGFRDGPKQRCRIEFRFDALGPLWNMKHATNDAGEIAGALHIEQVGRVSGSVTCGAERVTLENGYFIRDHSRGPRDLARYRWSCWMNGHLPGGRFFHFYAIQLQGSGTIDMANAAIFDGGRWLTAELLRTDLLEDPVNPARRHTFTLGCAAGEFEIRTVDVISSYPSTMFYPYDMSPGWVRGGNVAHMMDQGVWYECRGERCLGWSERGFIAEPYRAAHGS